MFLVVAQCRGEVSAGELVAFVGICAWSGRGVTKTIFENPGIGVRVAEKEGPRVVLLIFLGGVCCGIRCERLEVCPRRVEEGKVGLNECECKCEWAGP